MLDLCVWENITAGSMSLQISSILPKAGTEIDKAGVTSKLFPPNVVTSMKKVNEQSEIGRNDRVCPQDPSSASDCYDDVISGIFQIQPG